MSHVIVLWAVSRSAQIALFAVRQPICTQTDIQLSMSTSNKRSLSDESEDEYSASSSSAPPKKRVSRPSMSSENKENESDASSNIVKMKQKDLEKASKEELVGYVLALQKLVGKGSAAGGAALSPEKIAEKVEVRERDNWTRQMGSQLMGVRS